MHYRAISCRPSATATTTRNDEQLHTPNALARDGREASAAAAGSIVTETEDSVVVAMLQVLECVWWRVWGLDTRDRRTLLEAVADENECCSFL